jgi:hypothetical protein
MRAQDEVVFEIIYGLHRYILEIMLLFVDQMMKLTIPASSLWLKYDDGP